MKNVKINKKKVMSEAWKQARFGQKLYGGSAKMYFASSLELAWQANQGKIMSFEQVKILEKMARNFAQEAVKEEYAKYDAIWTDRIKITPALYDHGKDTVSEIVRIMPNLLTYCENCQTIDEIADVYGFATTSDLVEYLLAYKPRKYAYSKYHHEYFMNAISEQPKGEKTVLDECPF